MWRLVIFSDNWKRRSFLAITWAEPQNGRGNDGGSQPQGPNGHGWDIRLAVPGQPGNDYPTLGAIPKTTFSCAGKPPGYYADVETNCQAFRVCTLGSTYGFQSFLCPNGTLFNQAVFVCDWWMNVNCKKSEQFVNNDSNRFGKLRLGPELMKDIKKMLTHPMRNPYDKSIMKSNRIVMQEYRAPNGQLFPNGALIAGPERAPNNIYVPAKQRQQNFKQSSSNDITFSASTPYPQYVPAPVNNNIGSFQRTESFQKHRQGKQYNRNGRIQAPQNSLQSGNLITSSQASPQNSFSKQKKPNQQSSHALQQSQVSSIPQSQSFLVSQTGTTQTQRVQTKKRRPQNQNTRTVSQADQKQNTIGESFTGTQNTQNTQNRQSYNENTLLNLPKFSNEINGKVGRELKDNLVSRIIEAPRAVVTKTNSQITQQTEFLNPKSQVSIKTWIIKPNKKSRQLAGPIPYTYNKPPSFPSPTEKLVGDTVPYTYNVPTPASQLNNIMPTDIDTQGPYIYNQPTVSAKQLETTVLGTTGAQLVPTRPTFLPSTPLTPTKPARYYLTPTPFRATERLYLPPLQESTTLPRLYLSPNTIPESVNYQSSQLRSLHPTLQPFFMNINRSKYNLTFSDILTKKKLDMTVNNIVQDTENVLKTASPPQYGQYRQDFLESFDLHGSSNVLETTPIDSGESLTSPPPVQSTILSAKSGRFITPSRDLIPPDESYIYQRSNPLSKLPYFKEPGLPNTIERTVSIKITIPEKIATYLFKNKSDAEYDKLEILNTGSSNYLVLSNNNNQLLSGPNNANFIPIAKLPGSNTNNIRNISDSQALVYSFFTNSINLGREYRNLAQQEGIASTAETTTPRSFQSLNNQQITDITNKISNLTSSQFSSNNFYNNYRQGIIAPQTSYYNNQPIPFAGNLKLSNEHQARLMQNSNYNTQPTQSESHSAQLQLPNKQQSVLNNSDNIYSGQLYRWPVPEVTNQIYNKPVANTNTNTLQYPTTQILTLQSNTDQNNGGKNDLEQPNPEVEIIKAETINLSPAKLQLEPARQPKQYSTKDTLTNLLKDGNGITAHLQDKIVGTIQHPLEENKIVTYEKDQSYYLYTKLNGDTDGDTDDDNVLTNTQTNTNTEQNARLTQSNDTPDTSSFQLIPSINYELDEKEQQQILDTFQIDEFGAPRDIIREKSTSETDDNKEILTSNVEYAVDHTTSNRRSDRYTVDPLYSGPSSYTAPQASVGNLQGTTTQNSFNSKLEDLDSKSENGYPKERPSRPFRF